MDRYGIVETPANQSRKRKRLPTTWKKNIERQNRYIPKEMPEYPVCSHKKGAFLCKTLTMRDIQTFHSGFYNNKTKIEQDNFIVKHCSIKKSKKLRADSKTNRSLTFKYDIVNQEKIRIAVCREAFLGILNLKKDRLQGVLQRFFNGEGQMPKEGRGGDHRSQKNEVAKKAVQSFVQSLSVSEPHYCRGKSIAKVYLPPELNIKKLWRLYSAPENNNPVVRECFFRYIFNTAYNIGFGSPRTDACSTCIVLSEKLKKATNDEQERSKIEAYKKVHKLKAEAFYEILREKREGLITMSFDCQKNMPLPKLPDSAAYFSSQLNLYNFTIVVGNSKTKLTKNNVFAYCWTEYERPKGSNEIASAVFHRLNNTDFTGIETIRLVADGCGGQNKNKILICMLMKWLQSAKSNNVKFIEVIFPVVGHSYIPPDRVFAQIEKVVRKKDTITTPQQYFDIIKDFGTVQGLTSVGIYDFKEEADKILKPLNNWHFKFNPTKRFFLHKTKQNVSIQGEESYKSMIGESKYITKRGATLSTSPTCLLTGVQIKETKLKSIENLLQKHYGENWKTEQIEELQLFIKLINTNDQNPDTVNGDGITCELQQDDGLKI